MSKIVISGTGLFTPAESISNKELVASFNEYVRRYNETHHREITSGELEPLLESSAEFIEKASGIKSRHVVNKSGILDPEIMCPRLAERPNTEPSIQCEMAVAAAKQALQQAGKTPADIDAVFVACSNMQRPYPAMAIEVQAALGIDGFAYDLNVACSSAIFGLQAAYNALIAQTASCVLVVNPEICSGHLNFRDRDSHFIFGDACTAAVVETEKSRQSNNAFEIISTKLQTQFSNNIRNNGGFLNHTHPETMFDKDKLFVQEGRKVFKEVVTLVSNLIGAHLNENRIRPEQLKRLWLHQANKSMNELIASKLMGRELSSEEAPIILDEYANTSSAGSLIAFHQYNSDLDSGDLGVLCSFGAGYSIGNIILRKL